MPPKLWVVLGSVAVAGAVIGGREDPPAIRLILFGVATLLGAAMFWLLLCQEDARIRTTVAKITEQEAIALAGSFAQEHGWSWSAKRCIRLRFAEYPKGAGPTWEVAWFSGRSEICVWIDVVTGEVLGVQAPPLR